MHNIADKALGLYDQMSNFIGQTKLTSDIKDANISEFIENGKDFFNYKYLI
jgi:hypothetical protein